MTKTGKIIFLALLFAVWPFLSSAQEARLESSKAEIKKGEEFTVSVILHTPEPVNALEGRLVFPAERLNVKEIRDGGSAVNFWVEFPYIVSPGVVSFSGVTPGGFAGTNNFIFSVIFEAMEVGPISFYLKDTEFLSNDGRGSPIAANVRNIDLVIRPGDSRTRREVTVDSEAPEYFQALVASDPSLYDGRPFVVFATEDKSSGVRGYEIKEYRIKALSGLTGWKAAKSPYVLLDQELKSHIKIRAVDHAGNVRIADLGPANPLLWYEYAPLWYIIIIAAFLTLFSISKWKRKKI